MVTPPARAGLGVLVCYASQFTKPVGSNPITLLFFTVS